MGGEEDFQGVDGGVVEDEIGRDADELLFLEEGGEEDGGAGGVDAARCENFALAGDGEAALFKGAFDLCAGVLFVLLELDFVGGEADGVGLGGELFVGFQQGFEEGGRGLGDDLRAHLFAGHAGEERIGLVVIREGLFQLGLFGFEPGWVDAETGDFQARGDGFAEAPEEVRFGDAVDGIFDQEGGAFGGCKGREAGGAGLAGRIDFDDFAAADGDDGGELAEDEAIAGEEEKRLAEADADEAIGEWASGTDDFGGTGVEVNGGAAVEGFGAWEEGEPAIDDGDGAEGVWRR